MVVLLKFESKHEPIAMTGSIDADAPISTDLEKGALPVCVLRECRSKTPKDKSKHPKDKSKHPTDKSKHPKDKSKHPTDKSKHPTDKSSHQTPQHLKKIH